jgi:transposase
MAIKMLAPERVIELLEVFIKIQTPLEEQELKLMRHLQEAVGGREIPRGVGPLTFEILRREVGDWGWSNNWRQVSGYTGLCPRKHSSGGKRRSGSVRKCGSRECEQCLWRWYGG